MFRFPEISPNFSGFIKHWEKRWNLKRFLRSAHKDQPTVFSITPRNIYILPTRFGLMFGTLIIAILIGAINYANNLGYLLSFFLGGIGVTTIIYTWRNLLALKADIQPVIQPVYAETEFELNIGLTNPLNQYRGAIQLFEPDSESYITEDIDENTAKTFTLRLKPTRRGWYKINRLVLSTQYPLGLLKAWVYLNTSIDVLVYPKPAAKWKVPHTAVYTLSAQGDKGIGADDFVAHRNYRLSDSPRQIDWKIFAREKGLMTKQFGGDRSERLWLSFDLFPDVPVESAISKLTRAVIDADANNLEYGLKLPGTTLEVSHGSQHKQACLKALALYNTEDKSGNRSDE